MGDIAGIPPQVAQSPTATMNLATLAKSFNQSFMGRSANRFHSPVPLGALTTLPSNTKISKGVFPKIQSHNMIWTLSPNSKPREGCQSIFMPKSAIKSQAVGSSAFRNDMVLPEQAPPCSQSTLVISYVFLYMLTMDN